MDRKRMDTSVPIRTGVILALVFHLLALVAIPEPNIPEYKPAERKESENIQQEVNLQVDFQTIEEIQQQIQQPQDIMQEIQQSGEIILSTEGDTLIGGAASDVFEVDTTELLPDDQGEVSSEYVSVYETPPRPVHIQEPAYPSAALNQNLEGTVVLLLYVDIDGKVTRADVINSTNPLFNDAAVDAGLRCTFKPAESAGRPIRVKLVFPVNFKLTN
ncbi:energy transducer TonB [candidate division WOR-3 bacterium]|nr:energy transducer TonB [candidate division WOR-3 bacterium]